MALYIYPWPTVGLGKTGWPCSRGRLVILSCGAKRPLAVAMLWVWDVRCGYGSGRSDAKKIDGRDGEIQDVTEGTV